MRIWIGKWPIAYGRWFRYFQIEFPWTREWKGDYQYTTFFRIEIMFPKVLIGQKCKNPEVLELLRKKKEKEKNENISSSCQV